MFKSSRKRKQTNFNQELQLKLKNIHKDGTADKDKSSSIKMKYLNELIDEAVLELQTGERGKDSVQGHIHRNNDRGNQIHQISRLDLDQVSEVQFYSKINNNSWNERKHQLQQQFPKPTQSPERQPEQMIWNLLQNHDLIRFFKQSYPNATQDHVIRLSDFTDKACQYYQSLLQIIQNVQQQTAELQQQIKKDLTTTNTEILSLNALEILIKKTNLEIYLIRSLFKIKQNKKVKEMQMYYKKKLDQIADQSDQIASLEQALQEKEMELKRREDSIVQKQKVMQLKQKELVQKQVDCKKHIEERAKKIYETYKDSLEQICKNIEKKMNQSEKNMKYKIQIIQRKLIQLKALKNQQSDSLNKKATEDNEIKIKYRKIQKQLDKITKQHKEQISKYEQQQQQFIKNAEMLYQKTNKLQKKINKLKDKAVQYQQTIKIVSEERSQFEKQLNQVKNFRQKQNVQSKIVQPQIGKNTNRSTVKSNTKANTRWKNHSKQLLQLIEHFNKICKTFRIQLKSLPQKQQKQVLSSIQVNDISEMASSLVKVQQLVQKQSQELLLGVDFSLNYLVCLIIDIVTWKYCLTKTHMISHILDEEQNYFKKNKLNYFQILQTTGRTDKASFSINNQLYIMQSLLFSDLKHREISKIFISFVNFMTNLQKQKQYSQNKQENMALLVSLWNHKQVLLFFIQKIFIDMMQNIVSENSNENELKNSLQNGIGLIDILLSLSKQHPEEFLSKISYNYGHITLIQAFLDLIDILLKIFNCNNNPKATTKILQQPTKSNPQSTLTRKTIFQHIELIQQLLEKLSIILQRFFYWNRNDNFKNSNNIEMLCDGVHIKKLSKLYALLVQLNAGNGKRYQLIIANTRNILEI